jgi:hypothetical protein
LLALRRSISGLLVRVASLVLVIEVEVGVAFRMGVEEEDAGPRKNSVCPGHNEMISYLLTHPCCPESINSPFRDLNR